MRAAPARTLWPLGRSQSPMRTGAMGKGRVARKRSSRSASWPVATTKRVAPPAAAARITRSISGTPATGVSGLDGLTARSRLPWPAAMIRQSTRLFRSQRLSGDEFLGELCGDIVAELLRRMLAEIGAGADQHAALAAVERDLAAADRVDHNAGAVRAVLDREPELQVHRHVAEQAALHAEETELVVVEPGD